MSERRIGLLWRADLQVSSQHREGRDRAVIKDPLTLRYFELEWADYELAREVEAGATAREIVAHWREKVPRHCEGQTDESLQRRAERLCAAMHRLGLADQAGLQIRSVPTALDWGAWVARWLRRLSGPLFLRVRLFDPDEWLGRLVARGRPFFSPAILWLAAFFVLGTGVVAAGQFAAMQIRYEWFGVWQNLLALYLGILILKIVHESGHAIVCKALGGHVHEVGAQLLAFHPTFFVDVSDTWMWPDRRRRIAVAGAGFAAELFVAAGLFWLWMLLAPGFARDLCLYLMFIASVSAVLFNANPLMRYDGYHMLADFVREPQLRQRSYALLVQVIRRCIFGRAVVPAIPRPRRWLFLTYAVLSTVYLVWIALVVAGFLRELLAPYGLEFFARALVGAWILSMALPLVRFSTALVRETSSLSPSLRRRPIALAAAAGVSVCGLTFIPLPVRVEREAVLEAAPAGTVRAAQAGWVAELKVREGDRVTKGQILATMRNRQLALAHRRAEGEVALAKVDLLNAVGENRPARVQQTTRRFNEASANAAQAGRRRDELQLVSPLDGVVATRLVERAIGRMLRPGDELLAVVPAVHREGLLPLTEKEARRVREGAPLRLQLRALPGLMFSGRITAAPLRMASQELPRALTALAGGDLTVDANGQVLAGEVTHFARFTIDTADARVRPGLTGRVRLEAGRLRAGEWIFEKLLDAIHLDHRL